MSIRGPSSEPWPAEKKNESEGLETPLAPAAMDQERLVEAYESLRSYALGDYKGRAIPGLALLLHKGMAAWLEACARWMPPPPSQADHESSTGADLPPGLRGELVVVLTTMVLNHLQEVWR